MKYVPDKKLDPSQIEDREHDLTPEAERGSTRSQHMHPGSSRGSGKNTHLNPDGASFPRRHGHPDSPGGWPMPGDTLQRDSSQSASQRATLLAATGSPVDKVADTPISNQASGGATLDDWMKALIEQMQNASTINDAQNPVIGVPAPQTGGVLLDPYSSDPRYARRRNPNQIQVYRENDTYKPANWAGENIADLQEKMVKAGLLKDGTYNVGTWDQASMSAYHDLLEMSNSAGVDSTNMLFRLMDGFAETQKHQRALVKSSAIPDYELRQAADDAAQKSIGRRLTADEQGQFILAWRAVEQARINQQLSTTGGAMQDPTSVSSFADEFVRREDPTAYAGHQVLDLYGGIADMIHSTPMSAPSIGSVSSSMQGA